jgi:hypothetical protein
MPASYSLLGLSAFKTMKLLGSFFLLVVLLAGLFAPAAAADSIRIELNLAENVQGKCRLSFVIENKNEAATNSLKLDLVVFNREGIIARRLVAEMGPVYRSKTMIKTFEMEGECGQISSILINDLVACTPHDPAECLDQLVVSSRVPGITLFK